jgi:hypothetical protein
MIFVKTEPFAILSAFFCWYILLWACPIKEQKTITKKVILYVFILFIIE